MIRDQSCLNMIAFESKMQGDHEELKIFLQNCLISSRFSKKLGLQKNNISFYKKFYREKCGLSNLLKDDSTAKIVQFKWATIP